MSPYRFPESLPDEITTELASYAPLIQTLLHRRGITTADAARDFCNPDFTKLSEPNEINDMAPAIDRIIAAMQNNEHITIYGDYDADGVPGTAVLLDTFAKIGYTNVSYYIPHRHDEGFGLKSAAIDKLAERGTNLIITVDLGIAYPDEVAHANTLGIDTIITDHHLPGETLPPAVALVDPKLGDTADPMLCGAAVAFHVARALLARLRENQDILPDLTRPHEGWEKWLLDLVGISTISDMVPLLGENRILAHYGLLVLRKSRRPGIQALLERMRVPQNTLTEDDVAFSITPKLNAASRMDHAEQALKLLTAPTMAEAYGYADLLLKLNERRKREVATIMKDVYKRLDARDTGNVIVIGNNDWSHGVLGLVASKIVDRYNANAFVWAAAHDGTIKGSCRGYADDSVHAIMENAPDEVFIQFGGHEGAGGFSLEKDNIHHLESQLQSSYEQLPTESTDVITHIDAQLETAHITSRLYDSLRILGPYGMDNPAPTLAVRGQVASSGTFGKTGDHIEVLLQNGSRTLRAMAFYSSLDSLDHTPEPGDHVVVVGTINRSTFRGRTSIELRLHNVHTLDDFQHYQS